MEHKSGFVNIIGNPNVGKSTLLNSLIGTKLSIITAKAQTTRHRIHGIVNGEDYQVIFSDTPGILNPKYKLQETMLNVVKSAISDADVIIYVTDVFENIDLTDDLTKTLNRGNIPVILVLNKIDKSEQAAVEKILEGWSKILPAAKMLPVSALENFNLEGLFKMILEYLPVSPAYYPKDELTDKSERFFAAEILREKLLINYREEVPYAVEVEIESFKEDARLIKIRAIIYVERDSQKGIIIGNKGSAIKKAGTEARLEMEKFFDKRIFLEIFVKVKKDWRSDETMLKGFGYR